MIDIIVIKITELVSVIGYFGIFICMLLESTMIPLPSEAVMPFAGFLVAEAKMSFAFALIASVLGSIAGSFISYYIGRKGGKYFIKKAGHCLLLDEENLDKANLWFNKYGGRTIFFARFIPGVRHVISIPAGAGKMNFARFTFFTILGASIWNAILLSAGYLLQKNWQIIYRYTGIVDLVLIVIIFLCLVYWIFSIIRRKRRK